MAFKTSQQHLPQSKNLSAFFTNCKEKKALLHSIKPEIMDSQVSHLYFNKNDWDDDGFTFSDSFGDRYCRC